MTRRNQIWCRTCTRKSQNKYGERKIMGRVGSPKGYVKVGVRYYPPLLVKIARAAEMSPASIEATLHMMDRSGLIDLVRNRLGRS